MSRVTRITIHQTTTKAYDVSIRGTFDGQKLDCFREAVEDMDNFMDAVDALEDEGAEIANLDAHGMVLDSYVEWQHAKEVDENTVQVITKKTIIRDITP